jgi:azobenzene reductase
MRVMIIAGSLHQASATRAALSLAAESLREMGVEVDFCDLRTHALPLFDPDMEVAPPEVQEFAKRALVADGFLIGTPEYHNGMSGALKNALDHLGSRYFKHKPVGLLCAAGGGKGGINALANLRTVMRGVMAMVLPEQVIVDEDDFDAAMNLVNADRRQRILSLAQTLVRFVRVLEMEKAGA